LVRGVGGTTDAGARHRPVTPSNKPEPQPRIAFGVVVAPGLARDVTEGIADNLLADLRERYGSVDWQAELMVDRLVVPPALTTELFVAGGLGAVLESVDAIREAAYSLHARH
jgi:hypothetical protein